MQAFISYPREREEDAKYLATALGNRGFSIFLDRDSIQPGQDWDEAIRNGIRRSRVFVILFDQVAITDSRYFAIELEEIEQRLPEQRSLGLVVLYDQADASKLPARLARFHAVAAEGPREKWVGALLKAATEFRRGHRRQRALRWSLAGALAAVLVLGFSLYRAHNQPGARGTVRTVDDTCVKLISGLGTGTLTSFAEKATRLWLVSQSLRDVIEMERDTLLSLAAAPGAELRLLLMSETEEDAPNPVVGAVADWSNPNTYPLQFQLAHLSLGELLDEAEEKNLPIEARTKSLVPFTAFVIDWDSERAAIQFLPKLYRVSGGSRPVFELQRRCDPQAFDAIVASLERTWADATPARPAG